MAFGPFLPPGQFLGHLKTAKRVQVKSHIIPWAVSSSGKGSRGLCLWLGCEPAASLIDGDVQAG